MSKKKITDYKPDSYVGFMSLTEEERNTLSPRTLNPEPHLTDQSRHSMGYCVWCPPECNACQDTDEERSKALRQIGVSVSPEQIKASRSRGG